MAGRALFPELADAETIFPHLARELFHPVITGLLMVVVLSAIMSTVDSLLLLASSAVVRDTMQKIFNSSRSDRALARVGKVVTVIIGVLGITFAIEEVKFLFWFILFAWSGLGAAFGPVILCMLYYKKTTLQGAAAGMVLGFGVTILWILRFKADAYDLYEMIPGFFVGLLTTLIVSRLTWRTSASRE
jgi:Na+/proline symporter